MPTSNAKEDFAAQTDADSLKVQEPVETDLLDLSLLALESLDAMAPEFVNPPQ